MDMISAEEIKALMAKDEDKNMKAYLINIRDNFERKIYSDDASRNAAMSPILSAIECYDNWQVFQDKQQQALLTLQTLLNQAAETAHAYLSCDDINYPDPTSCAREKMKAYGELAKALAAIQPYLTTGDTNDR